MKYNLNTDYYYRYELFVLHYLLFVVYLYFDYSLLKVYFTAIKSNAGQKSWV
jgi:hypothetical protein